MNKNNIKYTALFLLVTFGFGYAFILVKDLITAGFPVFALLALRFTIGAGALYIARISAKIGPAKITGPKPVTRKEVKYGFMVGTALFLGYYTQTAGTGYTTPAKSGLYTGLYVIFVPLILMFIRKKFSPRPLAASIICFCGLITVSDIFVDFTFTYGDFLTVLCAFFFAFQFIFLEKYSPVCDTLNFTIIQLLAVACVSAVASLIFEFDKLSLIRFDRLLLNIVILGIVQTGLSFLIQTYVQKKIPASHAAVISCMESVFAIMFALIFGYDAVSLKLVIGSAIIIGAMIYSALGPSAPENGFTAR